MACSAQWTAACNGQPGILGYWTCTSYVWRYRHILVAMKPFLWAPRRGCFAALTADTPVLDVALSQDYAVDAMIFVGTEAAGLLGSTDKGRTWARLGQEVLTDSANKIILARGSSNRLCLLVMQDEALLMSRDGGVSWTNRLRRELLLDGVIALSAPCGLDIDSPLLVGLASGHILHG